MTLKLIKNIKRILFNFDYLYKLICLICDNGILESCLLILRGYLIVLKNLNR